MNPTTIPMTAPSGCFHTRATMAPGVMHATSRMNEMMLNCGGSIGLRRPVLLSVMLALLPIGLLPFHVDPSNPEEIDRLIRREPQRGGTGQEAVRQRHEQPLAVRRR